MAVPTSGINLPHAPRRYRPPTAPDAPQGALPGVEAEPDSLGGPDPESPAERRIEVEVVEEVGAARLDEPKPVAKKATARKRTPDKSRTTKKATTPSRATPPPSDS